MVRLPGHSPRKCLTPPSIHTICREKEKREEEDGDGNGDGDGDGQYRYLFIFIINANTTTLRVLGVSRVGSFVEAGAGFETNTPIPDIQLT